MKLSERDKTLLFILGIVLIAFLPWFFIVQPFSEKTAAMEKEITELESKKTSLMALELRRDEFTQEIERAEEEKERLLVRFPAEILQERSILFLNDTEKRIPVTLSQTAFDAETMQPVGTGGGMAAGTGSAAGADGAAGADSSAGADGTAGADSAAGADGTAGADGAGQQAAADGETAGSAGTASAGLTGICAQSQILYGAEYKNFKDLLKYILEYKERMVISDLTATYSADLNYITGNLVLKQYALSGGGTPVTAAEPEMLHGTSNVFMQASGIAASDGGEEAEADFFLMLSQPEADVEALIFGQSMDGTGRTHLTSEENKVQEAAVSFKGSEGSYVANYQIGDQKFSDSGDGVSFQKDGTIVFEVISSPRVGDQDQVGVSLDVINKTDRKVTVVVRNDDEKPRVTVAGITGDVTVK